MANLRARLPQILVILLGVLTAIWYFNLEWEEKEIDRGPTAEARRNPLLALQRLLEQRGQEVALVRGFAGLERLRFADTPVGADDTLVLLNTGRSLREAQVERLWQWLESGGRLLVAVDTPYFDMTALESDPLLERLGLALEGTYWVDLDEDEDAEAEAEKEKDADPQPPVAEEPPAVKPQAEKTTAHSEEGRGLCTWERVNLPVTLDKRTDKGLRMEFVSGVAFTDLDSGARVLAGHKEKVFFVHQLVGAGELYALPSMEALDNDHIHCQDNAYILWQILRDSDKVWLVLNTDSPNFWLQLWRLSAVGCIALLCALGVWLWYKVPRFGPVLERRTTGRRQFLDHIHASAQFLIRQQGKDALITPLRDEVLHKLRMRQPGFAQLPEEEQIARVVQLSGMTRADVHLALYRALPVPDPIFIDVVQRLQHLRNIL